MKNLATIKPLDNHPSVKIAHMLSNSLNICKWEIFRLLGTDHMMSISEKNLSKMLWEYFPDINVFTSNKYFLCANISK